MQGCRTKMYEVRTMRNIGSRKERIRKTFLSVKLSNPNCTRNRIRSFCSFSSGGGYHDEKLSERSGNPSVVASSVGNIQQQRERKFMHHPTGPLSSHWSASSSTTLPLFSRNCNFNCNMYYGGSISYCFSSTSASSASTITEEEQNSSKEGEDADSSTTTPSSDEEEQHTSIFHRLQGCETTSSDSAAERMKIRQSLLKGDSTVLHGPDTDDVTIVIGNHDLDDEDVENLIRQGEEQQVNLGSSTPLDVANSRVEGSKESSTTTGNSNYNDNNNSSSWSINQPIISVPPDLKSPLPDDDEGISKPSRNQSFRGSSSTERLAAQMQQQQKEKQNITSTIQHKGHKEQHAKPTPPRRRISEVTIAEVLERKHMFKWVDPVVSVNSTVQQAIITCIERGLSGMMVVDDRATATGTTSNNEASLSSKRKASSKQRRPSEDEQVPHVVGMLTSRDLLRITASGFKDPTVHSNVQGIFDWRIGSYMTPISQVIYARPDETIGMCRTIMAKLGVKCLPILNRGRVEGLITSRDLSEYGLEVTDRGGKSNFLKDVSDRVGVPAHKHVVMADPPPFIAPLSSSTSSNSSARNIYSIEKERVYLNVGVAELPHPFKKPQGELGMTKKQALKLSSRFHESAEDTYSHDVELSEDAHFVVQVRLPDAEYSTVAEKKDDDNNNSNSLHYKDIIYMGVADGVGSWREYGVDPRLFSHSLMEECRNILLEACASRNQTPPADGSIHNAFRLDTPAELLAQAYDRVKEQNIIGSSTACVAMFDGVHHQLHFSNLGDSGIIVLRHIDSEIAGALKRDRVLKREDRKSDLRVAFVSQQQLESFNHPYQLGWTGEVLEEGDSVSFKRATDSCTSSIHVRRGDILIMASDGLFDNVDIDDICQKALEWEFEHDFMDGSHGSDLVARAKRWAEGDTKTTLSAKVIPQLAKDLCEMARTKSLDDSTDSPFAILAKENDIMWSGGMPDDCTVIAMHVVGAEASSSSSPTQC